MILFSVTAMPLIIFLLSLPISASLMPKEMLDHKDST